MADDIIHSEDETPQDDMNYSEDKIPGEDETTSEEETTPKRKNGLTKETFDLLLSTLNPDRERAGEEYEKIRRKLIYFFELRGCSQVYELADKTIDRMTKKIIEGEKVEYPQTYALSIAGYIYKEYLKELKNIGIPIEDILASRNPPRDPRELEQTPDPPKQKERIECLGQCLKRLPNENRELILQYYQGEKSDKIKKRKKLAQMMGVTLNTLRIRAHRIREELEKCVTNCLRQFNNKLE